MLKRANNTEYGLASGVFTRDINKAMYVSEKLEAGTVFVNTYNKTDVAAPFGGVKQSGFGKDLGKLCFSTARSLGLHCCMEVCFMFHATLGYCFEGRFLYGSCLWVCMGTTCFLMLNIFI